VILRLDPNSTAYRLLDGAGRKSPEFEQGLRVRVTVGCFDAAYGAGHWEQLSSGSYAYLAPAMKAQIAGRGGGPSPSFDGCWVGGHFGRRWGDARGMGEAVEIAFTDVGRRFFDEQAAARDLAFFLRTPQLKEIRRTLKRGGTAPGAGAIATRFSTRVVALARRDATPPAGSVGVWSDSRQEIVVAERAGDGRRLYVTLRGGRIGPNNVHALAFVF
jgi:hypothetical protein